jgi:hypothetical protein
MTNPASAKQLYWINKLVDEKNISEIDRSDIHADLDAGILTTKSAGVWLDLLFGASNRPVAGAVTEPGFYRHDGNVYVVVLGKNSGRLYAKKVTAYGFDFDAAKGVFRSLKADAKMTVDEIRAFGCETGICANCAAELSDPISIFVGLGPTCAPRLMGKESYSAVKKEAKAHPATAAALAAIKARKEAATAELVSV